MQSSQRNGRTNSMGRKTRSPRLRFDLLSRELPQFEQVIPRPTVRQKISEMLRTHNTTVHLARHLVPKQPSYFQWIIPRIGQPPITIYRTEDTVSTRCEARSRVSVRPNSNGKTCVFPRPRITVLIFCAHAAKNIGHPRAKTPMAVP